MQLTYILTTKNLWQIHHGDKCVGSLQYFGASIDEQHSYVFKDKSTSVWGDREGLTRREMKELISNFYDMKERSYGHLKTHKQDADHFSFLLEQNKIYHRRENNIFFFFDQVDHTAAAFLL